MSGQTTVRHEHRTVSSSGASVSEPEIARPLITPDEAMRLGGDEALIFASGRPAIRARKLRYYTDPIFECLAAIPPPQSSDRIEPAADSIVVKTKARQPIRQASDASTPTPEPNAKPQCAKAAADPRQLSFLQPALNQPDEEAPANSEQQERLL